MQIRSLLLAGTLIAVANGRTVRDTSAQPGAVSTVTEKQAFQAATEETGVEIDKAWFAGVWSVHDEDEDGLLSEDEFKRLLKVVRRKQQKKSRKEQETQQAGKQAGTGRQGVPDVGGDERVFMPGNLFDELDQDSDDSLTREEVIAYFKKSGQDGIPAGLWDESDKDKNNVIDWWEFGGPKGVPKEIEDEPNLFEKLDTDESADLSREEVRATLPCRTP